MYVKGKKRTDTSISATWKAKAAEIWFGLGDFLCGPKYEGLQLLRDYVLPIGTDSAYEHQIQQRAAGETKFDSLHNSAENKATKTTIAINKKAH